MIYYTEKRGKSLFSSYKKEVLDEQTHLYLQQNMSEDIDFYEFARATFYNLLTKVREYKSKKGYNTLSVADLVQEVATRRNKTIV